MLCIAWNEVFSAWTPSKNINHTLYPLSEGVGNGNPDIALEKLKESPKFDENKKQYCFLQVLQYLKE